MRSLCTFSLTALLVLPCACTPDTPGSASEQGSDQETSTQTDTSGAPGEGDGDAAEATGETGAEEAGDGDPAETGDGDGDAGEEAGDGDGDGDGDPVIGDGNPGGMIDLGEYMINATQVTITEYGEFLAEFPEGEALDLALLPEACAWKTDHTPDSWSGQLADHPNNPVARVDWCDAWAYCDSIGARLCGLVSGEQPTLDDADDDPVNNEWFRACSDGGQLLYPYGNVFGEKTCNGEGLGLDVVVPVAALTGCEGSVPGLFDMSGNLFEWTAACGTDPLVDDIDQDCRRQGGSYASSAFQLRCNRSSNRPRSYRGRNTGIRCCQNP